MFLTIEPFSPKRSFQIALRDLKAPEDNEEPCPQEDFNGEVIVEDIEDDIKSLNNTTKTSESPQGYTEADEVFEFKPLSKQINPENSRMKFLQRLAHQKVWLNPLQQPK